MPEPIKSLRHAACHVLNTPAAEEKVALTHLYYDLWQKNDVMSFRAEDEDALSLPTRPARPRIPELRWPRDMPRRGGGESISNRIALLHALAHIELNAIDLAWDLIARFGHGMPRDFFTDWVRVADDEARHFTYLQNRLNDFSSSYGDLPAHDGLWQTAIDTSRDVLGRLAVVPLVLEARGLDVTPDTVQRMQKFDDHTTAALLHEIYEDEIRHVRAGHKWFCHICQQRNLTPAETYQQKVRTYFKGKLRAPFNTVARKEAGLSEEYYQPLVI